MNRTPLDRLALVLVMWRRGWLIVGIAVMIS